jgi:formylglycine-generating enzyme required for sulfatase activity
MMRLAFIVALAISGCSGAATVEAPAEPASTEAAAPRSLAEPVAAPEPAPAPEPATPELPLFPDGSRAKPCAEIPSDMACIPGGPFLRGTDAGPENARPAAEVWISTFYMDLNEVTYAQYRACADAGKCPNTGPRYRGYDYPNMPITGISWYDSVAYCEAQGKRLPTEAEWEKAARGEKGALYSWGDEPVTCELAIVTSGGDLRAVRHDRELVGVGGGLVRLKLRGLRRGL